MMGSNRRASATELAPDAVTCETSGSRSADPPSEADVADAGETPTPSRRGPTRAHVYISTLGWLLCVVVGTGIYSNVIADPASVRDSAASLARQQAGCNEPCRILHMEERRSVFGYRADYEMADGRGAIHVTCRRAAIVLGSHHCWTH